MNNRKHYANSMFFSKKRKKTKLRKTMLAVIAGFSLFYLIGAAVPNKVEGNSTNTYKKYTVQQGDTIWGIACSMINEDREDPREYVYAIQHINDVADNIIAPGDILLLPID